VKLLHRLRGCIAFPSVARLLLSRQHEASKARERGETTHDKDVCNDGRAMAATWRRYQCPQWRNIPTAPSR